MFEGVVLEMSSDAGYKAFKIRVTKDVYDGKEFTEAGYKALGNRVGEFVFVRVLGRTYFCCAHLGT